MIYEKNPVVGALETTSRISNFPSADNPIMGSYILYNAQIEGFKYGTKYSQYQAFVVGVEDDSVNNNINVV